MKKQTLPEKADNGMDGDIVMLTLNGISYYMYAADALTTMRIFSRAELRNYEYKSGDYSDGFHVAKPMEQGFVAIHNAPLVQLAQERIAWQELQTARLNEATT